ncbi:hypothetical protein [Actinopolymorpha rutila]|uniref:Uncharacterized protein n=1 Tax=Actinopolymorpha rutila TaxID=446787 RepID=A0A852ZVQ0_9ACTN|nr:hypothetical protein [Actinopolymorpha rutila]NYH93040.1 hypothetical protein [Actinopolymorpha rutila]
MREAEPARTAALADDIERGTVEWPTETDPETDDPETEETTG